MILVVIVVISPRLFSLKYPDLNVFYGNIYAIKGVSLHVNQGEIPRRRNEDVAVWCERLSTGASAASRSWK